MKGRLAGLLLAAAACVHTTPFTPRGLVGQSFPLRPGWSMALAVDGSVAGRQAVIRLAVEEPYSRVTDGCFDSPPEVLARVHTASAVAAPDAGLSPAAARVQEEVLASAVQLGGRMLGDIRALRDAGERCEVTLGSEILIAFVLEVDPAGRTVAFHSAMPPPPKFLTEESVVVELALDPRTDRPSLAVQLDTVGSPLTLPMVLATASDGVEVSAAAGRALLGKDVGWQRLAPGWPASAGPAAFPRELAKAPDWVLRDFGKDVGGRIPMAAFAPKGLALAPNWVLRHVVVSILGEESLSPEGGGEETLAPPALWGVLGADGWGHFRALVDLRGHQLVLFRRPPPAEEGSGPQSWTHLSSESTPGGAVVRFGSWQMLDQGGQVRLEPVHAALSSCRVGLTLGPEDPGYSLAVALPWAGLEEALPNCAKEVAAVPAWTGELTPGAAPRPCSGFCLYAEEVPKGRTLCHCSGPVPGWPPVRAPPPTASPPAAEPSDPAPAPRRR